MRLFLILSNYKFGNISVIFDKIETDRSIYTCIRITLNWKCLITSNLGEIPLPLLLEIAF